MAEILYKRPDGSKAWVPESDRQKVESAGYTPVTTAEDRPLEAVGQGLLRGATFGVVDNARTAENKVEARRLKEENPVANFVGEAAGTVAGLVGPGRAAIASRLPGAAVLAAEGALAGLGPEISEAALSNRDLSSELLAAGAVTGAITNLAGGAALKGVGRLASKAAGKAGEFFASSKVTQAASGAQKVAIKNALKVDDAAYEFGRKNGVFAGNNHESVADLANAARERAVKGAMVAYEDAAALYPDLAPAPSAFDDLVRQSAGRSHAKQLGILKDRVLQADLPESVRVGLEKHTDDFINASELYEKAAKAIADRPGLLEGVAGQTASAGIFGGPWAGISAGGAKAAKNLLSRGNLSYLADKQLAKLANGDVFPKVLEGFKARVDMMLQAGPGLLGPYGSVLARASAEGAEELFATHTRLASSEVRHDYMARMGITDEGEASKYGQKLAMLEEIEGQRRELEYQVGKDVSRFFKGGEIEELPKTPKVPFDETVKQLRAIVQNPEKIMELMPKDAMSAPGMTINSSKQTLAAVQFLLEKAPKPVNEWEPKAIQEKATIAPGDLETWNNYVQALTDPQLVAKQLARGQATPEAVEVAQTFYPQVYAEIQKQVFQQLAALKKPLSYDKQLALSNTFGPQILGISPQVSMYLQNVHQAAQQPAPPPGASQDGRQMVNTQKNLQTQNQRLENR